VRRLGLYVSCLFLGCGAQAIGPPPNAPSLRSPLTAMPPDLDLVLRLDLSRIRDTLGAPAMASLAEQAVRALHGADQATDALVLGALGESDTLWLGLRPGAAPSAADTVMVMVGRFPDFDPHRAESSPRFESGIDLGGDVRRYDRAAPAQRSAPARFYTRGQELVVSVSQAELDSVERAIELGRAAPPLEPAEKGVLSAAARGTALDAAPFRELPAVRDLARHARRCDLTADLTSVGLDAALSLQLEDASVAEQVADALRKIGQDLASAPGRLATLVARVTVSTSAEYVTLRLSLDLRELSEIVNCRAQACAW
jgi:hypothetical protein